MNHKDTGLGAWHAAVGVFSLLLAVVLLAVARHCNTDGIACFMVYITTLALFSCSLIHLILSTRR